MSKSLTTKNVAAVALGIGLVLALGFAFATPVKAQSIADLQVQIQALLAQIASLQGGASTSGGACVTFTRNHQMGESGGEIMWIQQFLNTHGAMVAAAGAGSPGNETSAFGALTKAAVAKFQAMNGIAPAAGYWGPITRAKANSMCAPGPVVPAPGAPSPSPSGPLQGGSGSVEEYTLVSGLNNEEVGEDQEDVEVAGLEVEADDGSDLEITAVRLVFAQGTANQDFDDYATEVSIWVDGEEFARVDADEFNDDNTYSKTLSLDSGAVIEAGETGEITVGVSGVGNLDSNDATDTWTVDFRQVRFRDADDATISEDPTTATRTFSFETFATASDVEFKIQSDDDDINDPRTLEVDASDNTDNVDVLSFTMEAEGDSDVEIKTFGVSVTVTGGTNTDDIVSDLSLWIDGEEVASANTVSSGGTTEDYIFEDVDYVLGAGETVEALIKADFNDIETTAFDEGDTILFALGEEQTDTSALFDLEDEAGENLSDANKTGSVTGGAFELRSTGIMVSLISVDEVVTANDNAADNDVGTFTIKYNVEAFGGDIYVSNDAAATIATTIPDLTVATDGVRYLLEEDGGTATVADVTDAVTFSTAGGATEGTNGVLLQEDEDADFTLTVVRTNSGDSTDDGLYRVLLKAIGWATSDTTTFNVYDFDLGDYKTDPVNLN